MKTMNIVLNTAITSRLQNAVSKKGYNNVSEYIRDLLRRDLNLESNDDAHYDESYLTTLSRQAKRDIKKGTVKKLTTLQDLLK